MIPKLLLVVLLAVLLGSGPLPADDKKEPVDFERLPKEAKAILDGAEKMELYSLDPAGGPLKKDAAKNGFHGWKVLGKTQLKEAKTRKSVMTAIHKGIPENFGAAGCFHPRHGIRATLKDKTVDLVICFECGSMTVYNGEKVNVVYTSASPQPVLDKVLTAAKVPLPKAKDE